MSHSYEDEYLIPIVIWQVLHPLKIPSWCWPRYSILEIKITKFITNVEIIDEK